MDIQGQFNQAQVKVKTLPNQPNDVLLKLYALFKQATAGDVSGKKPGMLDIVKKFKYEAWEAQKGKSKEDAMKEYIAFVDELAGNA